MSAPTLTPKQQKMALRSRQKKKVAKNVLLAPVEKEWTTIRPEDAQSFKEKLQRSFNELNIGRNKLQYKRGKDKVTNKTEAQKLREKHLSQEQKELRSRLILGLNAVTRSLEKKKLELVLVDANSRPSSLTNHLLWLSESSSCKCIAVPDLLETLGDILNVTSLVAIGIVQIEGKEDKFGSIIQLVEEYSSSIPQNNPESKSPESKNPESKDPESNMNTEEDEVNKEEEGHEEGHEVANNEEGEEEMETSAESENYDFRDLYVYKKDLPLPSAESSEPSPPKKPRTEQFIGFSKDEDDDVGAKRRLFPFNKAKIARIEGNPDRELHKKTSSNKRKNDPKK